MLGLQLALVKYSWLVISETINSKESELTFTKKTKKNNLDCGFNDLPHSVLKGVEFDHL